MKKFLPLFFAAIWIIYILLSPFYILPQGTPQPADYFIALFGFPLLFVAAYYYKGPITPVFTYGVLFALLTCVINILHFAFLPDPRFFYSAMYYIFNFNLFLFVLALFLQSPGLVNSVTYRAVAASLIIQIGFVVLAGESEAGRALGSFHNPNQLAYWTLLGLAMLIVLKRNNPFTLLDLVLITICLYLQALALSKAGMIATGLLFVFLFFLPNLKWGGRLFLIAVLSIAAVFALYDPGLFKSVMHIPEASSVAERLASLGSENDDNLIGRGYGRLLEYPHYLIFGAGEGGFSRFGGTWQELHAGFPTILFSYGIAGFAFFALFLAAIFRRIERRYLVLFAIVLLFSTAHQGFRFSHFWMLLGVCYTGRYLNAAHDERGIGAAEPKRIR